MIFRVLAFLLLSQTVLASQPCHPEIDVSKSQYGIGYGSLMEDQSRRRTAPNTGEALPAIVTGFERSFDSPGSSVGFSTTFLGVAKNPQAQITAAVYRIFRPEDVAATDARERGYCREAVAPEQVQLLDGSGTLANSEFWIYVNHADRRAQATEQLPLVQSYIDIFLTGCLQLKERATHFDRDFALECLKTTTGWSVHWVNDRIYPRRPFIYQPNAGIIDRLLDEHIPEFKQVRIE
jgi:hypothetical protein